MADITVYVVPRLTADRLEFDVFTDEAMAAEWALHIGAAAHPEIIVDRFTLDRMKEAYSAQHGRNEAPL